MAKDCVKLIYALFYIVVANLLHALSAIGEALQVSDVTGWKFSRVSMLKFLLNTPFCGLIKIDISKAL